MPPKSKFTKREIVTSALQIVMREGFEALTARSLGNELGSSSRPIFTVFDSMKEVQDEVIKYARDIYNDYIAEGLSEEIAFKGVGKAYIRFASEQPKLFQLLFMREQKSRPDLNNILAAIDTNNEKILESVQHRYGFNYDEAKRIYEHLWIYSHGIAVLVATGVCCFSEDVISRLLTEVCTSLIKKMKTEGKL